MSHSNNELPQGNFKGKGIRPIDPQWQNILQNLDQYGTLDLRSNLIGSTKAIESLYRALKDNKTILELDLTNNFLESEALRFIAKLLRKNKKIERLCLSCNKITDIGLRIIMDALSDNETLKILDLSRNRITDQGAYRLSELLQKHPRGLMVDLSSNYIGDNGVKALATLYKLNIILNKNKKITQEGHLALHEEDPLARFQRAQAFISLAFPSLYELCAFFIHKKKLLENTPEGHQKTFIEGLLEERPFKKNSI